MNNSDKTPLNSLESIPTREPFEPSLWYPLVSFLLFMVAALAYHDYPGWAGIGFVASGLACGLAVFDRDIPTNSLAVALTGETGGRRFARGAVAIVCYQLMLGLTGVGTYVFFTAPASLGLLVIGSIVAMAAGVLLGIMLNSLRSLVKRQPES